MTTYPHRIPADGPREPALQLWWAQFRRHLREPRFWVVQGLVVLAAGVHTAAELLENVATPGAEHLFAVVMYGLYAVPIVYASLYFGREGAIPTAIWAGLLSLPNILLWHKGFDRLADALQHAVMIALAVIVAGRVDREIVSRREAERAALARHHSEARYRALFEAVGEPILVFDQDGRIGAANAAAEALLGSPAAALRDRVLADVLGTEAAAGVLAFASGARCGGEVRLTRANGDERWLEPVCSRVPTTRDEAAFQTLFHDVTDRRQRQHDLEAYTRQIVAAQEEERRRIARELHDGPVQGLILLCRRLDELSADSADVAAIPRAGIKKTRQEAEVIADELRRFSRDLRPSILDDLGLVPALRWLVNDLAQRTGIRGRFVAVEGDHRTAREAELGLFRIAQEALRNVERHAGASEVVVALTLDDGGERLVVNDDGRGMASIDLSPRAALAGKLGLLGMQERARLCGGTLTVITAQGRGTRIEVAIPASSQEREPTARDRS